MFVKTTLQSVSRGLIVLLVLVWATPGHAAEAKCAEKEENCVLRWEFASPKLTQNVDRLNPITGIWETVTSKGLADFGEKTVNGGALYRVNGCDSTDEGGKAVECESTNAIWIPVRPMEIEIPAKVVGVNGQIMVVDKNLDLDQQTEQYNVYLLVNMLNAANYDISKLPPMLEQTEEKLWSDGRYTLDEAMQLAFYLNYSAKQEMAKLKLKTKDHGHRQ